VLVGVALVPSTALAAHDSGTAMFAFGGCGDRQTLGFNAKVGRGYAYPVRPRPSEAIVDVAGRPIGEIAAIEVLRAAPARGAEWGAVGHGARWRPQRASSSTAMAIRTGWCAIP
jgi:hypothetical protein